MHIKGYRFLYQSNQGICKHCLLCLNARKGYWSWHLIESWGQDSFSAYAREVYTELMSYFCYTVVFRLHKEIREHIHSICIFKLRKQYASKSRILCRQELFPLKLHFKNGNADCKIMLNNLTVYMFLRNDCNIF